MENASHGAYDPNFRPDRANGGTHNLPWTQKSGSPETDKTAWMLFDEEQDLHGHVGEGDITGIGEESYPGFHTELGNLGSATDPS